MVAVIFVVVVVVVVCIEVGDCVIGDGVCNVDCLGVVMVIEVVDVVLVVVIGVNLI